MNGRLTQPKVDGYIQWMRRNDPFGMTGQCYDAESCKLLDEFFALLSKLLRFLKTEQRSFGFEQNAGRLRILVV